MLAHIEDSLITYAVAVDPTLESGPAALRLMSSLLRTPLYGASERRQRHSHVANPTQIPIVRKTKKSTTHSRVRDPDHVRAEETRCWGDRRRSKCRP